MAGQHNYDAIVIGAGAAGLAALRELRQGGANAICLEARKRMGGRILTEHDPLSPAPIELGPEFIHGRPPEIWELVASSHLAVIDCDENAVHIRSGKPVEQGDSWDQIHRVTEDMKAVEARGEDATFAEFLAARDYSRTAQELATNYVEGFNAARKEIVGVGGLAKDARASEKIEGDRNFRILSGYSRVAEALADGHEDHIRLGEVVQRVEWQRGGVVIDTISSWANQRRQWHARALVITVPLGVLQAKSIAFSPEPAQIAEAAAGLAFGQVNRVVLRFHEPWWERIEHLRDTGFWLSNEQWFPTWWTSLPLRAPLLVGWSAGPHADLLADGSYTDVMNAALHDLAAVANVDGAEIEKQVAEQHFHNWRNDPYALGSYSYVPANAGHHREALAEPVEDTLFFSGEATELEGHGATVHGAIATGRRSARQILALKN